MKLHEFLTSRREEVIARTQMKVARRAAPRAAVAELVHGIPLFVAQLIDMLRHSESTSDEINASATKHGNEMLRQGFTVAQVVHDYGDVCQSVTELAFELDMPITVDEFHTLNRCIDDAIAQAVTEYERLLEKTLSDQGTERMGVLAHEMRNKLSTAMLSFSILKDGQVAIGGPTGAILDRSLKGLNNLIDRSLAEIRLESTIHHRETIVMAEFIEEMEVTAVMEAKARHMRLTVDPVEYGIAIDADRQLLAAAVANLLQNAFKFTRPGGSVRLRTHASADRVLIDIEDECGGLPPGKVDALFRPFNQRGTDRTGLGLGLSISRRGVRLNGGELRVRDVPGTGCVFTMDLPRRLSRPHHADPPLPTSTIIRPCETRGAKARRAPARRTRSQRP
jgi:signal transduction histidine kinase